MRPWQPWMHKGWQCMPRYADVPSPVPQMASHGMYLPVQPVQAAALIAGLAPGSQSEAFQCRQCALHKSIPGLAHGSYQVCGCSLRPSRWYP